jgi:general secretion pathway protein B
VSLILDALRKADAERERGSVPSLHSQPVVPLSAESPPKPARRPAWLWIAIGVAVGLLGTVAWVMIGREAPPPSGVTGGPVPAPQVAPGAMAAKPAAPDSRPSASTGAPFASTAPPAAAAAVDAQPIAEPAPWRQPEERKAPSPDAKGNAKGDAKADARGDTKGDTKAAQVASVAPVQTPLPSREQLPPNIRAELPQFAIGGSIYSTNPASRSLIVNGQLYREKDRLTQDLSLEEIRLKAAVFSFRGYRFEVLF